MQPVSAHVEDDVYKRKVESGIRWAKLIEMGLDAQEYKQRIAGLVQTLENTLAEKERLLNDIKRLESYIRRGGNYESQNGSV